MHLESCTNNFTVRWIFGEKFRILIFRFVRCFFLVGEILLCSTSQENMCTSFQYVFYFDRLNISAMYQHRLRPYLCCTAGVWMRTHLYRIVVCTELKDGVKHLSPPAPILMKTLRICRFFVGFCLLACNALLDLVRKSNCIACDGRYSQFDTDTSTSQSAPTRQWL